MKFFECKEEMEASQVVLTEMDDQEIPDVSQALGAVKKAVSACEGVAPDEEFAKMKDAEQKLQKQLDGLRGRKPVERPVVSAQELARLEKSGDSGCPRGQKYEHPQNKKMITCTGPQIIEMGWQDAIDHFVGRQGFSAHPDGKKLRLEQGVEVVDFFYAAPQSEAAPECLAVVGLPGISWQELVARATGVQPRRLKAGRPVPTKQGPLDLLVEGDEQQFTVKLGKCQPTPGQKAYIAPAK